LFQLVLQFRPWSERGLDELVTLEDRLVDVLGTMAAVDGHDLGSGEANIFILAGNPQRTFDACLPVIRDAGLLSTLSAAHRPVQGEKYSRLWPDGDASPFSVK
jgi:hypothetical protein